MKKIKKILILVILIFFILILVVFLIYKFAPSQQKGFINITNSKKVKIGMKKSDVIKIMGIPHFRSIEYYGNSKNTILYYQSPVSYSDETRILLDSSEKVINILEADS